jgi:hypothetical protein
VRAYRGLDAPIFIYTGDRLVGQAEVIVQGILDAGFLAISDPRDLSKLGLSGAAATTVLAFHEIIEAMNDPRLGDLPVPPNTPAAELPSNFGWLDRDGNELGDKCGTLQGFPAMPITLNGEQFFIQAQWSNQDHGCVYSSPQGRGVFRCGRPALQVESARAIGGERWGEEYFPQSRPC